MKYTLSIFFASLIAGALAYFYRQPGTPAPENPSSVSDTKQASEDRLSPALEPDIHLQLNSPEQWNWWHNTTTYQIWVRSFYDADGDGNGDLAGLTAKLDYIQSLGVDTLWLSPIFESPSYHGYDTSDFYAIEQDYGTMEDFERFLAAAKARSLKVILDLVVNHVSEAHPWFIKSLAKDPTYDDYFIWNIKLPKNDGIAWENISDPTAVWHTKNERPGEYYYGTFGWTQPDLNFTHPPVVEEMKKVAKFWLNKGVDGFRLDAIRYVIENESEGQADTQQTLDFWHDYRAFVKSVNPEALLIGEALTDTDKIGMYFQNGTGIDQAFEFNLNYKLRSVLQVRDDEAPAQNKTQIGKSLRNMLWGTLSERNSRSDVPYTYYASFINNHDADRLNQYTPGDATRAKIAAAWALLQAGAHYLYYGEEVGMMQAGTNNDMYRRALMQWDTSVNAGFNDSGKRWLDNADYFWWDEDFTPWWSEYWQTHTHRDRLNVAVQEAYEYSILHFYRQLIALKKQDATLSHPERIGLFNNTEMAWVQTFTKGNEQRLVVLNLDADNSTFFDAPKNIAGKYVDLLSDDEKVVAEEIVLQPGELWVLKK